jgi:hypothetical protein
MADKDKLIIIDPELGEIDLTDEKAVDEAVAQVPDEEITTNQNPTDKSTEDFEKYKKAWGNADIDTLESLREKHPEDARFNLHLQFMPESEKQSFAQAQKLHKEINAELGVSELAEFNKLMESGNITKCTKFVEALPENHPMKRAMGILIKYL